MEKEIGWKEEIIKKLQGNCFCNEEILCEYCTENYEKLFNIIEKQIEWAYQNGLSDGVKMVKILSIN